MSETKVKEIFFSYFRKSLFRYVFYLSTPKGGFSLVCPITGAAAEDWSVLFTRKRTFALSTDLATLSAYGAALCFRPFPAVTLFPLGYEVVLIIAYAFANCKCLHLSVFYFLRRDRR